jgi:hypothetical protein
MAWSAEESGKLEGKERAERRVCAISAMGIADLR